MTELLWTLFAIQILLGGLDTIYHHEFTERLAWQPSQRRELKLHAMRCFIYAIVFAVIGLFELHGLWAGGLIFLLCIEVCITVYDFIEEDRTRALPATERALHTILALNYGAILALFIPVLWQNAGKSTGLIPAGYGFWSILLLACSFGVLIFAVRDYLASLRLSRLSPRPATELLPAGLLRQRVLITGGTGFIGRRLIEALVSGGHDVTVLTRHPKKAAGLTMPLTIITDLNQIPDDAQFHTFINLAGEPIIGGLWTDSFMRKVLTSRVHITHDLVELARRLMQKPDQVIQGSAIGIYGHSTSKDMTEKSPLPHDDTFSQGLCLAWEAVSQGFSELGIRMVKLRTGIVLDPSGGTLGQMLFPFEYGLGGPFGSGAQMMSWISRDDLVRMILFATSRKDVEGALNSSSPHPVSNLAFSRALASSLNRPCLFAIPSGLLKSGLGALGEEIFLADQTILPEKAQDNGFRFLDPELQPALDRMVGKAKNRRTIFLPRPVRPAKQAE